MAMYKKPTEAQRAKIAKARKMTREGMEGEKDFLSKISTTMRKDARDQQKIGRKMMEEVPQDVRNYENEEGAEPMGTYKKGGKVMKHEDVKMDKKMIGKMLKAHADKPASKAHKGLKSGGMAYKSGGSIDGCATKGKTKGTMVKMYKGGSVDGCAKRGKTRGKMV